MPHTRHFSLPSIPSSSRARTERTSSDLFDLSTYETATSTSSSISSTSSLSSHHRDQNQQMTLDEPTYTHNKSASINTVFRLAGKPFRSASSSVKAVQKQRKASLAKAEMSTPEARARMAAIRILELEEEIRREGEEKQGSNKVAVREL